MNLEQLFLRVGSGHGCGEPSVNIYGYDRRPESVWMDSAVFAKQLMQDRQYDLPEYLSRDFFVVFDDLGAARDTSCTAIRSASAKK